MKAILFTAVLLAGVSAPVFADNIGPNNRSAEAAKHRPPPANGGYPQRPQHRPPLNSHPLPAPKFSNPSLSPPKFSNPSLQHSDPAYSHPPVYPHPQHPPVRPYPPQHGISIHYSAPSTVTYSSNSYSWVNGEPSSSSISSTTYAVVSDWRRLGLPAPPQGMYWIMDNGRYVLAPNR